MLAESLVGTIGMSLKLYGYWRSSAAYRLRIALHIKNIPYEHVGVNIAPNTSEQKTDAFKMLNPQMRVPVLETPEGMLTQSMAILEWIEETYPSPSILPEKAFDRAQCRAFADTVACDIHPLNNLSVLNALKQDFNADKEAVARWYADWIRRGFEALEVVASKRNGLFLFGEAPSIAEICLVPQVYNAHRFNVNLDAYPHLVAIDEACGSLEPFQKAAPGNQPDAS